MYQTADNCECPRLWRGRHLSVWWAILRASMFDKSVHAFIVYRGFCIVSPKNSDKCLLSKGYKRKNVKQRQESFAD